MFLRDTTTNFGFKIFNRMDYRNNNGENVAQKVKMCECAKLRCVNME